MDDLINYLLEDRNNCIARNNLITLKSYHDIILKCIQKGLSNQEIAFKLQYSLQYLNTYLSSKGITNENNNYFGDNYNIDILTQYWIWIDRNWGMSYNQLQKKYNLNLITIKNIVN